MSQLPKRVAKVISLISYYYRHPVYNQYLPNQFKNETFLLKEGDLSDREWNEEALKVWEAQLNDGKEWEGRKDLCNEDIMTDN